MKSYQMEEKRKQKQEVAIKGKNNCNLSPEMMRTSNTQQT